MKEFFTAAFWRGVWWYLWHPYDQSREEQDAADAYERAIMRPPGAEAAAHMREALASGTAPRRRVRICRYCPDPLCPEDCPECGGPIHDLDAAPAPDSHHYSDNGNGISGMHTGRVEDCPGPGCGPLDCEATAATADMTFGPCVKATAHKGWHEDADGSSWTERCQGCGHTEGEGCDCPPADTVSVPRDALRGLVEVAEHVSSGPWFMGVSEPYPDATAQRALGALDDAGLLDQFREDGDG